MSRRRSSLRAIPPSYARALNAIGQYFGRGVPPRGRTERFTRLHRRSSGCSPRGTDDAIVGGAGALPFELSVPGGRVPCCGHDRRRRRPDAPPARRAARDDARAARRRARARRAGRGALGLRGSDLRALRLRAARRSRATSTIAARARRVRAPVERRGTLRLVEPDEALETFPPLWDGARASGPGCSCARASGGRRALADEPADRRGGAGPKRLVLLERRRRGRRLRDLPAPHRLRGRLRRAADRTWSRRSPPRRDAAAAVALPARHRLGRADHGRRSCRPTTRSSCSSPSRGGCGTGWATALWVRLVDVGAALAARDVRRGRRARVEVRDAFCPWNEGRWRLAGGQAERTDADAGPRARRLRPRRRLPRRLRVARARARAAASRSASRARSSAPTASSAMAAPWCPEIF